MHIRWRMLALLLAMALCLSTAAMASEEPAETAPPEEEIAETEDEPSEEPVPAQDAIADAGEWDAPAFDGASNEEICFQFLTQTMGFNTAAACGILANIYAESGFNPNVTGDQSTSYGICQWHDWGTNEGRYTNLKNFCADNGYDYHDLTAQLYFLQYELTTSWYGFRYVLNAMYTFPDTAEGAYDAGYYWCKEFGRPADSNENPRRGKLARDTYYPKYAAYAAPAEYVVTFDADGGAAVPSKTVSAGAALSSIPLTVREGYAFSGWYTGRNGGGTRLTADTAITGDITYYACWVETAPETYTVTYDANGGSGTPMPQKKTQGTALTITATKPKRTGYTFLGWAESADAGSAAYLPGGSYTKDANITLYAVWQASPVPRDANGDGALSPGDAAAILGGSAAGVTAYDAAVVLKTAIGLR